MHPKSDFCMNGISVVPVLVTVKHKAPGRELGCASAPSLNQRLRRLGPHVPCSISSCTLCGHLNWIRTISLHWLCSNTSRLVKQKLLQIAANQRGETVLLPLK